MEDPERVLGWWQRCRRLGSRGSRGAGALESHRLRGNDEDEKKKKNQKSVVRGKAKFSTGKKSQKVAPAILP